MELQLSVGEATGLKGNSGRFIEASRTLLAHVRQEKNGALGRQQEHALPIRERRPPGGLNQLVRAGDVKSRQVLCFGLFSSVFNAEGNVPLPEPHQGLYDFWRGGCDLEST